MKRFIAALAAVSLAVVLATPALASPAAPDRSAGDVIPLGFAVDDGRLVEGYAIVHRRDPARPDLPAVARAKGGVPGRPAKPSADTALYSLMGKGVRWRVTEGYLVNTANDQGLASSAVMGAIQAGADAWDAQVAFDVFGPVTETGAALSYDAVAPDGLNEVYFLGYGLDPGTVAVTITWGIFRGPPAGREIVECDMVMNDALAEPWGDATVQAGVWDVQDIATHELGHCVGLADLYEAAAAEQTMFGYASPGETKKRTLESGDIAGVKALYE